MNTPIILRIDRLLVCLLVAEKSGKRKRARVKRKTLYSKGQVNQLIDSAVHPLANEHWLFIIVDSALHALNEQDPIESFTKFLKYNAPELAKRILKQIL